MGNGASQGLSVGDRASASGLLLEEGAEYRLILRGEDIYGELFNRSEYAALPVRGLESPPLNRMVTVRGTWTGDSLEGASVEEGGRGIAPPQRIEARQFDDVDGAKDRSDILRDDVLEACETIRGGALVSFVAIRGSNGWFGLASAVDAVRVQEVLGAVLGTRLLVVPSPWTLNEIEGAQDEALKVVEPYQFGSFWDDDARFRGEMVVHHISPELASLLEERPTGILRVEPWLRREE